jgi:putative ABC transport system ATP-binding protein
VTKPAIQLDNVDLSLGSGASRVHVLKSVGFVVPAGQSVGIVGPSGSGKSTLLMVLAGLERAGAGAVEVAGERLDRLDEDGLARFRGRAVGIVFQSFHLLPTMTALENVAVPLELAGRRDAFERAEAELVAVGLGHRLHHHPAEMSGGEQQRVAIARALAPEPSLLIADEPTGNLDADTGAEIIRLMFEARARRNATLILVTHDRDLAARCDRRIAMRSGEVVEDTRPAAAPGFARAVVEAAQ